jgi:hypothetical protein
MVNIMADPITAYRVEPKRVSLPLSGGFFGTVPPSRTEFALGLGKQYEVLGNSDIGKSFTSEDKYSNATTGMLVTGTVLIALKTGGVAVAITTTGGLVLIPIAAGAAIYAGSVLSDDSQIISDPIMDQGKVKGLEMHILPDTYKGMDVKTIRFEIAKDDSGKPIIKMFEGDRLNGHGSWFNSDAAEIPELIEKGSKNARQSPFHIEGHPPGSPVYNYVAATILADQMKREPNYQHFTNLAYVAATHLKTLDPEQNLDPNARITQQSVRNIYANALAERKKTIKTDPAPVKNGPEDFLKLGLSIADALDAAVETAHLDIAYPIILSSSKQSKDIPGPDQFIVKPFYGNSSPTKDSFIRFVRGQNDPAFREGDAQRGIFPIAAVEKLNKHLNGDNGRINTDARNIYHSYYTNDGKLKPIDITDQEATKIISNRIAVYFGKTIEAGADGIISPEDFAAGLKK